MGRTHTGDERAHASERAQTGRDTASNGREGVTSALAFREQGEAYAHCSFQWKFCGRWKIDNSPIDKKGKSQYAALCNTGRGVT